jgi:hypothetical protein
MMGPALLLMYALVRDGKESDLVVLARARARGGDARARGALTRMQGRAGACAKSRNWAKS